MRTLVGNFWIRGCVKVVILTYVVILLYSSLSLNRELISLQLNIYSVIINIVRDDSYFYPIFGYRAYYHRAK